MARRCGYLVTQTRQAPTTTITTAPSPLKQTLHHCTRGAYDSVGATASRQNLSRQPKAGGHLAIRRSSPVLTLEYLGSVSTVVAPLHGTMKFANTRPDLSLKQLVVLFLDNTRVRFGYQSSEVAAIESALRAFQNGQISKRDAFSSMVVTLDHHEGLKQDLWNVLFHEDARWADGDFDLVQLAPQFLEPAHQPRFRLPHLTPWFPDRTRTRPAEPTGTDHLPTSNYVWPPVSGDTALLHHQEDWNDHPQPSTSSPISQWASQSLDPVVAAVQPVRDWRQGQTEGSETAASSHLGMHEDLQSTQDYGNWDESSNFSGRSCHRVSYEVCGF